VTEARSLVFVTRADCGLCEEGLALVGMYARREGVSVELVDVDSDRRLTEQFGDRVPVVLDSAGTVLAEGRIGASAARRAAARAAHPGG
jgi:hypothetical protein